MIIDDIGPTLRETRPRPGRITNLRILVEAAGVE
jgi:hypothetical protein